VGGMIGARVREQAGFGLIELLIAMTVMVIAITAIVAAFSSGLVALSRASRASTAATLADKQMEAFRVIPYTKVALNKTLLDAADAAYTGDSVLAGDTQNGNFSLSGFLLGPSSTADTYCNGSPTPATCKPTQSPVTGPDGVSYRVDTYIVWSCALGALRPANGTSSVTINSVTYTQAAPGCLDAVTNAMLTRPAKRVTVVVRDTAATPRVLFRVTSTFDLATACDPSLSPAPAGC
jgi:prepilin-type N-terminal cleavage/methylation domain-containing protein